jgi:hypothetical protein
MKMKPAVGATGALEGGLDLRLFADKMKLGNLRVSLQCLLDSIDDHPGSVVAPHNIHDDAHKWKERSEHPNPTALQGLRPGRDRDDLASLVKAASWADAMRNVRGVALRTLAELRELQNAVVGSPHPLAASRWFSFWNAHNFSSL